MSSDPTNSNISEHVHVYCRQRYANKDSPRDDCDSDTATASPVTLTEDTCTYSAPKNTQKFIFDGCFTGNATQEEVFNKSAKPLVDTVIKGYSAAIVCYGYTGAGKTFTMRGKDSPALKGIMPRCVDRILDTIDQGVEVWASYLQIYCENITDLLNPEISGNFNSGILQIREKSGSVYVEGLSRSRITCISDFYGVLERGDVHRCTAATNMNASSSRSHAVCMLTLIGRDDIDININEGKRGVRERNQSTLVLVDLAGSERYG